MSITAEAIIKRLLLLFLVIAGLHFAQQFLIPLAIAAILATLFLPLSQLLENNHIPRWLATLVCLLLLLIIFASIGTLVTWQISNLLYDVALIKEKALTSANSIQNYIFTHLDISIARQGQILKNESPILSNFIQSIAGSVADIFSSFVLTIVYVFLLLLYRSHIKTFLLRLAPQAQQEDMQKFITSSTKVSQQYLVGLAKMIGCLWIMYSIGFAIVGVDNPIFFAILCGLLEIVPFVGNLLGTTITVLVAAVNGAALPMLGGILITYGIVQFIQGWVLEPLIVGPQVKINPLFTIIALVLGNLIWGIPGVIIAIPLTAIFKIGCDHIESLKPYGFLIGEIITEKPVSPLVERIKSAFSKPKA
jgi:predicted PurR-regulated permease PerM